MRKPKIAPDVYPDMSLDNLISFDSIDLELEPVDFAPERDQVEAAALAGMPHDKIAREIGLSVDALRKRYPAELALTPERAREQVIDALRRVADHPKPSQHRSRARAFLRRSPTEGK